MQVRFNLAFSQTAFYLYVTLIMAKDAPKRRFLSLVFLVLCISKSFLIRLLKLRQKLHLSRSDIKVTCFSEILLAVMLCTVHNTETKLQILC